MKRAATMSIAIATGCMVGEPDEQLSSTQGPTFEEFRASTYREPWDGGMYIVDGDTPIADDKALYEFWAAHQQGALIVNRYGGSDDRWTDQQKLNLTYCISNNFGANKTRMVEAMRRATETIGWETMAAVNFVYVPAQDSNCTKNNSAIVFPIRQVSNQPYLARAFFPSSAKSAREVLVDTSSFAAGGWPLENVMGHELGHVLGFRHEHTRPEAGTCFEDNSWRALSPYDSKSIMHYPQCNGSSNDLNWSSSDRQGAAALYGAAGAPPAPQPSGTARTDTQSGSLAKGATRTLGPYAVVAGSTFSVVQTGTGDPDLYVRWNAAPTTTSYNCRPYLDGADEQCVLSVPSTATSAYVMIRGYSAASYTVDVSWTAP